MSLRVNNKLATYTLVLSTKFLSIYDLLPSHFITSRTQEKNIDFDYNGMVEDYTLIPNKVSMPVLINWYF
jgi:hypothetical protein